MPIPPSAPGREGDEPRVIGRYALFDEIAAGGMATVHIGRLRGPVGFSRTVAIKRLHPQYAKDPEFVAMFLDEARLAARIRHPNVVPTLDVVALDQELFLVMEYVQGESLSRMIKASRTHDTEMPLNIVTTIMTGVLHGLHAAHEARTEHGEPLSIVHRDVSPQNVLVGVDGVPRVLDFGVAKAAFRAQSTRDGQIKGKIAYMPPEQIRAEQVDRRCDVYAAAAVLWEAVTRARLYKAESDAALLAKVLFEPPPLPSAFVPDIPPELERIIMRGLAREPDKRYATAREMALELETCLPVASASALGGWVERLAGEALASRARRISDIESTSSAAAVRATLPHPSHAERAPAPPVSGPALPVADDVTSRGAAVSQVTLTAPGGSRALAARRLVAGVAGAALLLIAFFVVRAATQGSSPAPDVRAASAASAPPAVAESPDPTTTAAPPPTATEPPPIVSAKAPAPPTPPARTWAPPPARPAGLPARGASRPSCTPPYTVDSSGIRHMKPECL